MLEKLSKWGRHFIDVLIVLVFIEAVMSTYPYMEDRFGGYFEWFNTVSNMIFVVEIVIRILFGGKRFWIGEEWTWNWFDLIVTVITVASTSAYLASIRSLRLLRLLRLLRVFTIFKGLRAIVGALLNSIPKISWLIFLWVSVMVIYAVIGCHIFRDNFPELFGDFTSTCFTMFQLMTLDGWSSDICREVMKEYPFAWVYFISYICITAFILLNALTGVMCSSMNLEDEDDSKMVEKMDEVLRRLDEIEKKCK